MSRSNPSDDYVRVEAKIYGRNPTKKVTDYQAEINDAAIELALEDPNLLMSRQRLLELARTRVRNDGYKFKKGKSRSKQAQCDAPAPKRAKTSATLRVKHVAELEEDIKDLDDRLNFKEKRRNQATLTRNYKACDQLTEEMASLKKQRREYTEELRLWKRKQQQANWYKRKGSAESPKSPISTSESDTDQARRSHSLTPLSPTSSVLSTPIPLSPQSSRRSTSVSVSSTPVSPLMEHGVMHLPLSPSTMANVSLLTFQGTVQSPSVVDSTGLLSSEPILVSDLPPSSQEADQPQSYPSDLTSALEASQSQPLAADRPNLLCQESTSVSYPSPLPLSSSVHASYEIPQSQVVDLSNDIPEEHTPASHIPLLPPVNSSPSSILESQEPDLAGLLVNPACGQSSHFW